MTPSIRRTVSLLASLSALSATSAADAQPVSLNSEGIGQVLIYPYYTTRAGWTTLLSIVNNDSANGKAVKVRFLEGKNGASVASFNLFLAPDDIWTGAVVPGSSEAKGAQLVSNDDSCTFPSFRPLQTLIATPPPSIEFSNQTYLADGDSPALRTIDRTREGYVEVIEMASIPYSQAAPSPLMQQIFVYNRNGHELAPCSSLNDTDLSKYSEQILPPSGGLSGAATLFNVVGGASAEFTPTALTGFWLTSSVVSIPPTMTASTSQLPNLSSGGNTTAQYIYDGKTHISKFNRSVDAVSATLMATELLGEHAYTADGVIGTTWLVTSPTKRFYTQVTPSAPFARAWDGTNGTACEDISFVSADRNAFIDTRVPDSGTRPPEPLKGFCFVSGTLSFGGVNQDGGELLFGSLNTIRAGEFNAGRPGTQNGGNVVMFAGKEGGKTRLKPSSSLAALTSASGSVTSVDVATGQLTTVFGSHTLYGHPMIGVAVTQSSFKTGNPQQNYASGFRLQSIRRITTP